MSAIYQKLFLALFLLACASLNSPAQADSAAQIKRVNFGYSQNPKTRSVGGVSETANRQNASEVSSDGAPRVDEIEKPSIARKTLEIARRANSSANLPPTDIYKIGVGDVLFISLKDAPAKASTYFTVLNDGTIDYPLAGEMVGVAGLTSEEIEALLGEKVKLYDNPQISVKVRENASHSIMISGLVEKAGEQFLQREAVPLYVVKAAAVVSANADSLVIKRANSQTETLDLKDAKSDDALIFPGDVLDFKVAAADAAQAGQFYYIGGEIISAGQKDFHPGLTLTQAILACGGVRKSTGKKAVVRRKNQDGLLSPIQFDLSAIREGKQPDPVLQAGDTIEIVRN